MLHVVRWCYSGSFAQSSGEAALVDHCYPTGDHSTESPFPRDQRVALAPLQRLPGRLRVEWSRACLQVGAVNVSTASTRKGAVVGDRARSGRGVSTAKLDLGAAKRHCMHRWVLSVAPSPGANSEDRCDLEGEGRDIPYGVTDQIIT
jgi:hypothetical protein